MPFQLSRKACVGPCPAGFRQTLPKNPAVQGHEESDMKLTKFQMSATILTVCIAALSCASPQGACTEQQLLENKTVKEQLACIYDLVNKPGTVLVPDSLKSKSITYTAAMNSLLASDYLVKVEMLDPVQGLPTAEHSMQGYYPTAEGMEYLYKHKHPWRFWMKENWFPFSIAAINAVIGLLAVFVAWRTRSADQRGRSRRRQAS